MTLPENEMIMLEEDIIILCLLIVCFSQLEEERQEKWQYQRINWEEHVEEQLYTGRFNRRYRMSLESFTKLVDLLCNDISVDSEQSRRSTGGAEPIIPEVVVACGLRYCAGGSYIDLASSYKISEPSVFRSIDTFLAAVRDCPELDFVFPSLDDAASIDKLRKGFEAKSYHGIMRGCVGAIDGMFQQTIRPSPTCAHGNVRSYFSGHYNKFGLNVQAICDPYLRFTFFGVLKPGSSSDLRAYESSGIHSIIESLPYGTYIVGDAAYMLTDRMLVPFTGSDRVDPSKDAFNFYLSQLRIRIEMAFGLLTNKWRILRTALSCKMAKNSLILEVCARLHNFVITNDIGTDDPDLFDEFESTMIPEPHLDSPLGWGYLPTTETFHSIIGSSAVREAVLGHIQSNGFRRPAENEARQKQELFDIGLM